MVPQQIMLYSWHSNLILPDKNVRHCFTRLLTNQLGLALAQGLRCSLADVNTALCPCLIIALLLSFSSAVSRPKTIWLCCGVQNTGMSQIYRLSHTHCPFSPLLPFVLCINMNAHCCWLAGIVSCASFRNQLVFFLFIEPVMCRNTGTHVRHG